MGYANRSRLDDALRLDAQSRRVRLPVARRCESNTNADANCYGYLDANCYSDADCYADTDFNTRSEAYSDAKASSDSAASPVGAFVVAGIDDPGCSLPGYHQRKTRASCTFRR
jgi:hypothetical protein